MKAAVKRYKYPRYFIPLKIWDDVFKYIVYKNYKDSPVPVMLDKSLKAFTRNGPLWKLSSKPSMEDCIDKGVWKEVTDAELALI